MQHKYESQLERSEETSSHLADHLPERGESTEMRLCMQVLEQISEKILNRREDMFSYLQLWKTFADRFQNFNISSTILVKLRYDL